ncbi:MAG: transcription-repair coupling factor [Chitinophagales bacterium]
MNNIQHITTAYQQHPTIQKIAQALQTSQPSDLFLKGLVGSMDAFVAAGIFHHSNANHLFILSEKEEAAYFQNNLQALIEKKDIFFFPDSFKRPQQLDELNNNNVLLRTETINRITNPNSRAELIVSYPEALFEKVVKAEELTKQTLHLKTGEKFDVDFAIDLLVEFEFERVDFVYEPGQFSIRGGIVDIYSFGNEFPYRIELFGNDIESIRTFDPISQLSQKKIERVSIVPNIQTHFTNEKKTAVFEALPPNTIVWIKDVQSVLNILNTLMNKAETLFQKGVSQLHEKHPLREGSPAKVFLSEADFLNNIRQFHLIEFGRNSFFNAKEKFDFHAKPQPSFNKNFNLLISDLKANAEAPITNFIFAENPKQIERFYAIFDDLKANVPFTPIYSGIHSGFIDDDLKIACYTDHQIFNRYHKYNLRQGFSGDKAMLMKTIRELKPGDFVTHIDHGVGVYSGLEKIEINGQAQETVRLIYAGNDILYVGIQSLHKISKYIGKDGDPPRVNKLGTDTWANLKKKTKKKIKEIAFDLIQLYARRKSAKGFQFSPDGYLQNELEASFIYEDTPDQAKATEDVKRDMQALHPMDRLVCGDVGFGKTEVAIRAAFKAACDGKQVAVLVPTTILALQHYKNFKERLSEFPIEVDYLNRFKTAKEKTDTLKRLEEGKTNIIIGTHALVGKRVKFKDLGLLVIDEEQKFGVGVKETLKELKSNIDSLTLTATPIPRTLQFSMMGARDLSIINTPPPNRQGVVTEVHPLDPDIIREAMEREIYRGGQVFFVHNKVKDIAEVKLMLQKIVPNVDIGVAHGQMEGEQLEEVIMRFINREFDVLLSTNIIESGIDIPNANTIIINNAHQFGLSDLHQLRGRVGRSNKQAFCYLFSPPLSTLSNESKQRLKTIEEFSELGSGFNIAMRDLDIRGAGNLLGGEQSGFIAEIGMEVYQKILDEAVRELKESDFKELYQEELAHSREYTRDCAIETDLEMLIPDNYVKSNTERMLLYRELNEVKDESGLEKFRAQLNDRFGKVPHQVLELFNAVRVKWLATQLGMERIILKNKQLKCYFIENQTAVFYSSDTFSKILTYVQQFKGGMYLRETEKHLVLTVENIASIKVAMEKLTHIHRFISEKAIETEEVK